MLVPMHSPLLAAEAASQTNVMVALIVAAIGATATFIVGLLNFRAQRQTQTLQKSQQDRQLQLMLESQITNRFTDAINQLGSRNKAIRIGGIFALERLARESMQDRFAIAYTLAAFIRQSQPISTIRDSSYTPMLKIRAPDVQAALTVLGRSPLCEDRKNASEEALRDSNRTDLRLDLSRTDLRRASLSGARLDGVNLYGTRLEGANLRNANLRCAGLSDANLGRLNPRGKKYKSGADLSGADLTAAYLDNVLGLREAKVDERTRGLRV